ncbi:hypothetical protein RGQ29_028912 [Quercus rubra]|uniref:NF-X1-type domain-containing protein n=1 Tax=Quercus rubra TaxID=3512 RepID=A0AAN7IJJ9_QUERU|nr:hypothetical protein RGQ29_028912 [Quercus rubra]KAK4579036.1 hypothetical protein RGQ29_028912 [Quercus rubra]KAK4579037.1 hypothetical protein RGQ29_028912 [Quercus rubra]
MVILLSCGIWCLGGAYAPCLVMVTISCACGETHFEVPCGTEMDQKPPRCPKQCHIARLCRHGSNSKIPDQLKTLEHSRFLQIYERRPTCSHPCPLPCHPGECPPCKVLVKRSCHCGSMVHVFECLYYNSLSEKEQMAVCSCGGLCHRKLSNCTHLCPETCHPGACPSPDKCRKKVFVRCKCQTLKKNGFVKMCKQPIGMLVQIPQIYQKINPEQDHIMKLRMCYCDSWNAIMSFCRRLNKNE